MTLVSSRPQSWTRHHFVTIDGRRIFYREAGDPAAPTILLLHGAPASSFMFRALMPLLAERHHLIAPDYIGFGLSDSPTVEDFDYTFDTLTDAVDALLHQMEITRFAIYVQDYGAPIGWRLALRHPTAVTAVITQNGNAYTAGFVPAFWDPLWAYAADPNLSTEQPLRAALTLEAFRWQYTHGEPDPSLVSPDAWHHDYDAMSQRPGNVEVQLKLFREYPANVDLYPAVHAWLRESGVPVLAVWGKNDQIFGAAGAEAFRADCPHARVELLDGGHFLLEAHLDHVAGLITELLDDLGPLETTQSTTCSSRRRTS
jgi:pimeloyl-ACP methyl ester carboxylesterase